MDNANERFKQIRDNESLTQAEFAEKLNISRSYIADVERGKREINTNTIKALKEVFKISADWLLFGEGGQEIATNTTDKTPIKTEDIVKAIRHLDDFNNIFLNAINQAVFTEEYDIKAEKSRRAFSPKSFYSKYKEIADNNEKGLLGKLLESLVKKDTINIDKIINEGFTTTNDLFIDILELTEEYLEAGYAFEIITDAIHDKYKLSEKENKPFFIDEKKNTQIDE